MAGFSQPKSSSSLPYLAPASQGQSKTYSNTSESDFYGKFAKANRQTYISPEERAQQAQETAIRQARQADMIGSGVKLSGINRASYGNGNPMSMKGESTVTMGDGQTIRIPNALAQQLEYTQSVNSGRWGLGEFFGEANYQKAQREGNNPQDFKYSSWGAAQGAADDWMAKNPAFSGSGYVNPYVDKVERLKSLDERINSLSGQMMGGVQRESVSASGQSNSNSSSGGNQSILEALRRERQGIGDASDLEQRNARLANSGDLLNNFPLLRATYSNLPIVEKVVKK